MAFDCPAHTQMSPNVAPVSVADVEPAHPVQTAVMV